MDFISERQQSTVAAAITVLSTVVILSAAATIVWLLGAFLGTFSNVFLPLAVAGVLALILKPYFGWFRSKLRSKVLALLAVFLMVLVPGSVLLWLFGDLVVEQFSGLVEKIPTWWQGIEEQLKVRLPRLEEFSEKYGLEEKFVSATEGKEGVVFSVVQFLADKAISAGAGLFGALGGLFSWAVFPVYVAFFLLMESGVAGAKESKELDKPFEDWVHEALPFLKPETRESVAYLVSEFVAIIVAFFRGQFLIAFAQGVLYAIGFTLVGLEGGFVLGMMLGFLNIIPYLGSIVGLGVALPLGLIQEGGGWGLVLAVLAVFTVVQTIEGYVLTPKVMGDSTGLHPMAIIVAMFFWGSALNGIVGLVLAIPLTAFFVVFWRLAREKYMTELV
jgi:predicted PurR-regulated permease PerM